MTNTRPHSHQIFRWHVAFVMNCNLRCSYCITDHGTYGNRSQVMSSSIQQQFINHLAQYNHPFKLEFGTGETFLAYDTFLSFVDQLRASRKQTGFQDEFSVVTNGTLLTRQKIDALRERDISLTFSLDGDRHVHQHQRTDHQGHTFHDRILDNYAYYLQTLVAAGMTQKTTANSVITEHNSLVRLNAFWKKHHTPLYTTSISIPHDFSDTEQMRHYRALQRRYLHDLKTIAFAQAAQLSNPGFLNDYQGPLEIIEGWLDLLLERRQQGCGIFKTLLALNAFGELFPCELLMNTSEMRLGTLEDVHSPLVERLNLKRHKLETQCNRCQANGKCPSICFVERYLQSPDGTDTSTCAFSLAAQKIIKDSYEMLS